MNRASELAWRPKLPRRRALLVLLVLPVTALGAGSCTSQPAAVRQPVTTTVPPSTPTTHAPVAPLQLALSVSAAGSDLPVSRASVAKSAAPSLRKFLASYAEAAFPADGSVSYTSIAGFFDPSIQAQAKKDLAGLGFASDATTVALQQRKARATAALLSDGHHAVAATVQLSFGATATTTGETGAVRLRSVLQLLVTSKGWRIIAYDSRTGPSA